MIQIYSQAIKPGCIVDEAERKPMQKLYYLLTIMILAWFLTACTARVSAQSEESQPSDSPIAESLPQDPPASCPVTVPQKLAFVPPAPYSPEAPFPGQFWYGTNSLWTLLPTSGSWVGLPHSTQGYGQKVFWWRDGYVWTEEPQPEITVTAERLDAEATPFQESGGTNAYASDIGSAMLTGVNFSTAGCWKVTGTYGDAELSFVIWVAP
jgi:hypothetical protein